MGDQTIADNIVTAKAGGVVAENLKLALSTASGSLTPSTITAMVGISQGSALQLAPDVTATISKLSAVDPLDPLYASAQTALTNLTTLQGKLLPSGNHAAFGSILQQAHGHISDSVELNKATSFISNTNFSDLGTGITNMSTMATRGLDGAFGSLGSAANAISAAGPCFDLKDMANFGTGTGLVNKLSSVKLGNASGINAALAQNGVDLTSLNDPVYKDTISKTLSTINDPATIKTVTDQLGVVPHGSITNLNDLTDITKLASPSAISGLTGGLSGMADKFSDMGAKFTSPGAASDLLNNVSIPSIPSLNAAAPSLSGLMSSHAPTLDSMTGLSLSSALSPNLGPGGLPSVTDFAQSVAGGPAFTNLNAAGVTADTIAALEASTSKATSLFSTAGVDLNSPPPAGLGSAMRFATNLHKFGTNSEISGLLGNMAVPGSQFGDSIKASLAEGKNKALMAVHGIKPLNFQG